MAERSSNSRLGHLLDISVSERLGSPRSRPASLASSRRPRAVRELPTSRPGLLDRNGAGDADTKCSSGDRLRPELIPHLQSQPNHGSRVASIMDERFSENCRKEAADPVSNAEPAS